MHSLLVWPRVAIAMLAALAASCAHVASDGATESVEPRLASQTEQAQILQAVLEEGAFFWAVWDVPPPHGRRWLPRQHGLVLLDRLIAPCDRDAPDFDMRKCTSTRERIPLSIDGSIPKKLRLQLRAALEHGATLPEVRNPLITRASPADIASIFSEGGGWHDFYARYPDTAGLFAASRAVLSEDGRRALIYAERIWDNGFANGYLFYMRRSASTWKLEKKRVIWAT
ncbi:MAG: hypothetical protein ABIS07_11935 [Dokdonella sp.]